MYESGGKLNARIALHQRFSTGPDWFAWLRGHFARRVLDVGCGMANLWRGQAGDVVLADLSPGMLRDTTEEFPRVAADVCALPFPDARFDTVGANHMLYHVADRDRALAEIRRVLVPGGRLVASTNGRETMREMRDALVAVGCDYWPTDLDEAFGLETGPAQVARHFNDVRVEQLESGLAVTDAEAVVAYVASMDTGCDLDALRAYVEEAIRRDGVWRVSKVAGVVLGVRA